MDHVRMRTPMKPQTIYFRHQHCWELWVFVIGVAESEGIWI